MKTLTAELTAIKAKTKTALDPTIAGLPWGEGFKVGIGINAVTGVVSGTAVDYKNLVPSLTRDAVINYSLVSSEKEMEQQIEVAANGKYNMDGVKLGASASFLNKIAYSETAVTLVAKYEEQGIYYEQADEYQLTAQAKNLISSNPEKFRSIYGDYFISGQKMGSRFLAVYTCRTTDESSMNKFKASFSASAPEVFEASGSTDFEKAAKENNVSITINIYMDGINGTPPNFPNTPEGVLEALKWFKANKDGEPLRTMLTHYSVLDNQFSPTVNIAPEIFVELRQLYSSRWIMNSLYDSLPFYYRNQYEAAVSKIDSEIESYSNILSTDAAKRKELMDEVTKIIGQLKDIYARQDFYFKVKAAANSEPKENEEIKETKGGPQHWLYGYSQYPKSTAVVIHTKEIKYFEHWHTGHRQKTIEFGPDQNNLIVGWELVANDGDGTDGYWWKATNQIILTSYGAVHIKSKFDRGVNWTVRYFYVDAKDYQFGDTIASKMMLADSESISNPITNIKVVDEHSGETIGLASFGNFLENNRISIVVAVNVTNGDQLNGNVFYRITAQGIPAQPRMRFDGRYEVSDGFVYVFSR